MSERGFVAYGQGELACQPPVGKGDRIRCGVCGGIHQAHLGINVDTGQESDTLVFVRCEASGKAYLVGVAGKLVSMALEEGA